MIYLTDISVQHFEKLFQFARKTEELLIGKMPPEEVLPIPAYRKKSKGVHILWPN